MDHNKTRAEVEKRKTEILERQQQIPQEIRKLNEEMEFNKRQLIGIEQILDGLSFMDGDTPYIPESFGLTDSVRQILSDTTVPLVPTQIRDALEAKGVTGTTSKNLLINVHKVLERIEDELDKSSTPEGKTAYKRTVAWAPNSMLHRILSGGVEPRLPVGLDAPGKHPVDQISRRESWRTPPPPKPGK